MTPPETRDESIELLEKLKDILGIEAPIASGDGVSWPLSDVAEAFTIDRGSSELQLKPISGEATFTDPEVRDVFEELADLIRRGYFSTLDEWTA